MDDYAGRVLADRYRLPLPPSDEYELTETRAFDTYSGQEVLVRQVPLPEVVEAEVLDAEGLPEGFTARTRGSRPAPGPRDATRRPADPAVRRAVEAVQAAARIPDHPRLDQVFDVFAEGGSLWVVSELVAARPLSALLAEQPLTPYRAAEVASDVLMALRVLHAHGWVHRNVTARTVLVCDDGRVMLTGLAVGAAEEALCGYDPVPVQDDPGTQAAAALGPAGAAPGRGTASAGGPGPRTAGDFDAGAAAGARGPGATGGGGPGVAGGRGPGPAGALGGLGALGVVPAAGRGPAGGRGPDGLSGPGGRTAGAFGGTGGAPRAVGGAGAAPGGAAGAGRDSAGEVRGTPGTGVTGAFGDGGTAGTGVTGEVFGDGGAAAAGGGTDADADPEAARRAAIQARMAGGLPVPGENGVSGGGPGAPARPLPPGQRALESGDDIRAARAGAIAAYRAGTRAAARVQEAQQNGRAALPAARPAPEDGAGTPRAGLVAGRQGTAPFPQPPAHAQPPVPAQPVGRWDAPGGAGDRHRGPATALAAERARQVRMTVVGPVTERWSPEQAGPVHENWQLAAPIGPATDLWALGALLFRAVQGHAPYPEESTAELVQLVCAEPPAFAEECGPLRPVVESLLRQDPTDRLDFEELSGWLRSLVRSAPEPDAGAHVIPVPPADPSRLPIVRRRGELVRRRRRTRLPEPHPHGRHKRAREEGRSPRSLGRTLILLILLLLAGAIAYAMLFMPKQKDSGAAGGDRTGSAGQAGPAPSRSARPPSGQGAPDDSPSASAPGTETQTGGDPAVADGFTLRKDPDGFRVAVAEGWDRTPRNDSGQVVYAHGNFELIVVPGRDSSSAYGGDPMAYQRDKERELQPYRDSSWATATGLKTIEVGGRTMAEGQFTWTDGQGRDLFVRNTAILLNGRYHIVQVRGPEAERDEVTRLYEQAAATYRYTG
ncbi:protein kinase [Streptomyces sp. NPDC096012]|uniref:protein kinase n=1 Tax=Streptomyces sp. NPDC096012 TaxID=3155684 RepID=UPI00336A1A9F